MTKAAPRQLMEYQSIGTMNVLTDKKRRDVLIAFEGDPNEEKTNIVVRLACTSVPALAVLLHKATEELDKSAGDATVVGQVLTVSEATSLEGAMGRCMISLGFLGFQVPLVMSKEVAESVIGELSKSLEALKHPRNAKKLS